jgi:hypothetical protein
MSASRAKSWIISAWYLRGYRHQMAAGPVRDPDPGVEHNPPSRSLPHLRILAGQSYIL